MSPVCFSARLYSSPATKLGRSRSMPLSLLKYFSFKGCQRAYISGGNRSFSSAPSGFFLMPIRKGSAVTAPQPTSIETPGGFRYSWEEAITFSTLLERHSIFAGSGE